MNAAVMAASETTKIEFEDIAKWFRTADVLEGGRLTALSVALWALHFLVNAHPKTRIGMHMCG